MLRNGDIVFSIMKITVELPDELLIAAKKRAAEARTSLREIIERALRRELFGVRRSGAIRWVTAKGGLPPGMDISDRAEMHKWLQRQR